MVTRREICDAVKNNRDHGHHKGDLSKLNHYLASKRKILLQMNLFRAFQIKDKSTGKALQLYYNEKDSPN